MPTYDRVVHGSVPGGLGQHRVGRQFHVPQSFGYPDVVGMHHAGHALAHRAQVVDLRIDEGTSVDRPTLAPGIPPRYDELGMGLHHMVLLHECLFGQLPVHGEPARVPPLGSKRLHLPGIHDGGERLDALP